mgnify:CR=1 FL=1
MNSLIKIKEEINLIKKILMNLMILRQEIEAELRNKNGVIK